MPDGGYWSRGCRCWRRITSTIRAWCRAKVRPQNTASPEFIGSPNVFILTACRGRSVVLRRQTHGKDVQCLMTCLMITVTRDCMMPQLKAPLSCSADTLRCAGITGDSLCVCRSVSDAERSNRVASESQASNASVACDHGDPDGSVSSADMTQVRTCTRTSLRQSGPSSHAD